MWNSDWNNLPPGMAVDPRVEEKSDIRRTVYYPWYPSNRLWDGEGTPYDVAYCRFPWGRDYLEAYGRFIDKLAVADVSLLNRADAVTWYYSLVATQSEREEMFNPRMMRPTYPLAFFFGLTNEFLDRSDAYSHLPDAAILLRTALEDLLRQSRFAMEDLMGAYLGGDSQGLTREEKEAALKSARGSISPSAKASLLENWKGVGGSDQRFEDLWAHYESAIQWAVEQVEAHNPTRRGPRGREALVDYLGQVLIPHRPEDILGYAVEQAAELESVMAEVSRLLMPSATNWQEVVRTYPFDKMLQNDEDLLARYQEYTISVLAAMQKVGLLPPTPDDCELVVSFTPDEDESTVPTAACRPAPRQSTGGKRVSRMIVTKTHGDPVLLRKHRFMDQAVVGHEGSHGVQGFFSPSMPQIIKTTWRMAILGYEGNAFSNELAGWKFGAYPNDLITFLYILQGRLQRALRVVFEFKYHMDMMSSVEQGVREYGDRSMLTYEDALADCQRSMADPGQFSGYYLGAQMASALVNLVGGDEVTTLRQWLVETGANVSPSLYAWMKGHTASPTELFEKLPQDAGVVCWKDVRASYVS